MNIFKGLEFYIYSAAAAAVTVWASHHPMWHDPALWFMGVIGHAIGYQHHATNGKVVNGGPPAGP